MSRKEKLAAEYADDNASNGFTKFVLLKGFLAGYAACEQDAMGLVEALKDADLGFNTLYNHFICEDFIASGLSQRRRRIEVALAKWKERGE